MHSFDPIIAKQVGINAAVIYQNIFWWCEKNKANRHNEHEGRYWTYNSIKAWALLFPYLTPKQIRTALDKLETEGLILSGNFNASAYDRTKWYCPSKQIDLPSVANEVARKGQPIPVVKPDNKPDDLFGAEASKPSKQKKAIALPENWVPSDKNTADAQERGFTMQEINHEADQFRNYHVAKGSTFKNWDAAWRTWLGNARKFAGRNTKQALSDTERNITAFAATNRRKPSEDLF